jgi:Xaa-Pro aminopeptidase
MVVSNEPGYYEDGNFGIRIENLLEIQYLNPEDSVEKPGEENGAKAPAKKKFLRFKKLTMIPIQLNLIDLSLMTGRELDWIDAYHEEVFEKVSPLLAPDSPALAWLTKSCEKIIRP